MIFANRMCLLLAVFVLLACQISCASNRPMYYEMAFNTHRDGQNAIVLDYDLFSGSAVQFSADSTSLETYGGLTAESIHRSALYPTRIYFKWRDIVTGKEYSVSGNLKRTSAEDLTGYCIYPMVLGSHLDVYLISPHRNTAAPHIGPGIAFGFDTELIYSN